MKEQMVICLDGMGGDSAPKYEVAGALLASKELIGSNVKIVLLGKESILHDACSNGDIPRNIEIHDAPNTVSMNDEPSSVVKKKKDSSLYIGIEGVRTGKYDAFVSSGNTGAVMATSTLVLGRIAGVSRPTIGSFFPTLTKLPTLLLDVGANVDSKPKHLVEFAQMGSVYYREFFGIDSPKVALLNVGEEASKGNETTLAAYQLMTMSGTNFIGNVEGRDIFAGTAHVVVCDGFTGNIVLKFAESIITLLKGKTVEFAEKSIVSKARVGLMVPTLRKVLKEFDYQEYGGVPLLGVNGIIIIGHGKSSQIAVKNMILRAVDMIRKDFNKKIHDSLSATPSA